jgi:hypothetical protein
VAAYSGVVAIAIEGPVKTAPGTVALYRAATLDLISSVSVGALPDMVTFTPDGAPSWWQTRESRTRRTSSTPRDRSGSSTCAT